MTVCRSCGAEMCWATTAVGKAMPLNPHPDPAGNVRLTTIAGQTVAQVVGATIDLLDPTDDGVRYIAHFATCPHADRWRQR
jgi:hypothetical protein